ncbi:DUF6892 domain-containing protein [Corallincola spongiicola]|uniref:DUF6892 domain-containing protein n=1 Tax=Corallincola spongiicola TaxID=2520508 RepID=A0ABY1WS98_9GAMM|nr:hypothetical protein [Corallincola spongiicola]TAA47607.1 hypothetical protein EXY25_10360 [Corallincola spongiicola]
MQESETKGLSSQCLQELLEPALTLYFYHGSSSHSPEVLASVAVLCVKFFTLFPECHNNLLLSLLAHHTQPPQAYADVLLAGVRHHSDFGVAHALAFDMFSKYAERDDPEHKHALATMKLCVPYVGAEEGIEHQHFFSVVFWSPLGISFLTQAQRVEEKQKRLALIKCKKIKAEYKAELDELTQHFDVVVAREWLHAVKRVAVSKPTFNVLLLLVKSFPSETDALKKLRDDVVAYRDRPKQFALPKRPKSDIKDFALKLAVIEQLMYRQNVLSPKFDIHAFAAEYDKRQIDITSDGYEIIPEAQKYFRNLTISPEQLAKVTELYFDCGLGGGASVYQQMWPFWDPGCGDEVIAVTTKAAADIQQLPNLKKVVGLEHFSPPVSVCRALVKHGVEQIEDN